MFLIECAAILAPAPMLSRVIAMLRSKGLVLSEEMLPFAPLLLSFLSEVIGSGRMNNLRDILSVPAQKDALVSGCVQIIETRVGSRGGLKGVALKTGMTMLKKARPGFIERATSRLLPDFILALEPLHAESRKTGNPDFAYFLQVHATRATQALLAVADQHVAESSSNTVKSTYARLRGDAASEVQAAIPDLGQLIGSHLA
ncbi:MAG: DUF6918 family protein [Stenotrophobium sp.]